MQTQAKFCPCFTKVNTKSTPKITNFLSKLLPKLHEPAPSNAIP